ncbi:hypothetical protein L7F22_017791 [Adiantum nelumboides]|nr:hypothetical protein [Adiantum nelumboides]
MVASVKFPEREVIFKRKGRDITLHVNEKGHTIPLVSRDSFDKAMKSSIFAYMILVKDAPNSTDVSPNGSLKVDYDSHSFLNEHAELFIYDIPSELPLKRGDDDHKIDLIPGSSPPNKPPYLVSQAQQEEIMSQVNELVQKGIVRLSSSPFCSLVILVHKKDGTYRIAMSIYALERRMHNSSNPSLKDNPTLSATYITEVVGGCEVQHRNLSYGDTKIHFVECGNVDGELVILVHGFPNFWLVWKNQFKALAEAGYHVIAPDLRGYNSSSRPSGVKNYGLDCVTRDLLYLVDCCSNDQAVSMVGHDWGGCAVWAVAELFPNRLKKIVTVNSPHFDSLRNLWQRSIRQRLRSWYFVFFQLPGIPEAFLRFNRFWALRKSLRTSSLKSQCEEDIERYVEAYSSPGALTGMINYYRAAHAGYWEKSGRTCVSIPVKVIWGVLDRYLDCQLAKPPKDLVQDVTVVLLPEVHSLNFDFLCVFRLFECDYFTREQWWHVQVPVLLIKRTRQRKQPAFCSAFDTLGAVLSSE